MENAVYGCKEKRGNSIPTQFVPQKAGSASQQLLLVSVFGKMFASPIFSSLWSACAIVLKHLCMKIKPVSTGVTLHSQGSHGKRQPAARAFLKCM